MPVFMPAFPQTFYQEILKKKLNPGGIFATQSGAAGVLSCTQAFTPINKTLSTVFEKVTPYTAHVPSFCDTWVSYEQHSLHVTLCSTRTFIYFTHRWEHDFLSVSDFKAARLCRDGTCASRTPARL